MYEVHVYQRNASPVATWVARLCTIVYFLFFFLMPWYTARDTTRPVPERLPVMVH